MRPLPLPLILGLALAAVCRTAGPASGQSSPAPPTDPAQLELQRQKEKASMTAEVHQAATAAQTELTAMDGHAGRLHSSRDQFTALAAALKAAQAQGRPFSEAAVEAARNAFMSSIAEQSRLVSAAESDVGAYISEEDKFSAKYGGYVYPDLRAQLIGRIISAKSDVSLQRSLAGVPDAAEQQQQQQNAGAKPQPAAGPRSGQHEDTAAETGRRPADKPSPRREDSAAVRLPGGMESLSPKPLAGGFQAGGGGSSAVSSPKAGVPQPAAQGKPGSRAGAEPPGSGGAAAWKEESEDSKAARLRPDDPKAWVDLAWEQLHLKNFQEALKAIDKALALSPDDPKALALRAFIYEQLGRRDKMLEDLRRAAALAPARYGELLRRALAGKRLFDPDDPSTDILLEGLALRRGRGARTGAWGAVLGGLCLLAAGLVALRRRGRRSVVGRRKDPAPPPNPRAAAPAQAVAEESFAAKYRILRPLGSSGQAGLWEAQDLSLDRAVLVQRLIFEEGEAGDLRRARALRELHLLAALRHPGIERVLEAVELGRELRVVLEAAPWRTAESYAKRSGAVPFDRVRPVLAKVCQALSAAHARGLLHRCVTPAKIQISERGYVRLTDFGSWGGCEPEYRAPETEGGTELPATDVYSLGATLYALVVGSPPYSGDDIPARRAERDFPAPTSRVPGLPAGVDDLVRDALAPSPAARPQSAQAFRERLLKV